MRHAPIPNNKKVGSRPLGKALYSDHAAKSIKLKLTCIMNPKWGSDAFLAIAK
jgi:hypothetical protein